MKIILQGIHIDLTPAIRAFIEEKLAPIERMTRRLAGGAEAEAWVELGRTTRHHRKGPAVYEAEVHLRLPRMAFRVSHSEKDPRVAIDRLVKKLKLEIVKHKEKAKSKFEGNRA